jgi:hypothetical protein
MDWPRRIHRMSHKISSYYPIYFIILGLYEGRCLWLRRLLSKSSRNVSGSLQTLTTVCLNKCVRRRNSASSDETKRNSGRPFLSCLKTFLAIRYIILNIYQVCTGYFVYRAACWVALHAAHYGPKNASYRQLYRRFLHSLVSSEIDY